MYTPPCTPRRCNASSTCRYDVSFEMRLSESKKPPGSERRSTSRAKVVSDATEGRRGNEADLGASSLLALPRGMTPHASSATAPTTRRVVRSILETSAITRLRCRSVTIVARGETESRHQPHRVVRCMDLRIIIEIDVYVASLLTLSAPA